MQSTTKEKLVLKGSIDTIHNVDATLTRAGWSADAKVTGDRLTQVENDIADAYEAMGAMSGVDPAVVQHVANKDNPHKTTAAQIGLGNVPNVATNDQKPTYTSSSKLTALVSGEKLSTAFGKIARAVSDFISHIGDKNNPHSVTLAQATGTLPLTKGGTGATTASGALKNFGLTATAAELNYCDGVTSNIQEQIDSVKSKAYMLSSGGTALKTNDDLNDYTTAGVYSAVLAVAQTVKNSPISIGFKLVVEAGYNGSARTIQTLYVGTAENRTYTRRLNDGTWSAWDRIATDSGVETTVANAISNAKILKEGLDGDYYTKLPAAGKKGRIFYVKVGS